MKKLFSFISILTIMLSLSFAFAGCSNMPQNIPDDEKFDDSNWEVTFFDDFNGDKLDTTRWRYATGEKVENPNPKHIHRGGYYSSDDDVIYVKDGNLYISTKYKKGQYGEGWYSGWIESTTGEKQRAFEPTPEDFIGFTQKYGYFECRCIAPPAQGMWSAFWLMPNNPKALTKDDVQWTASDGCEVDIMESQNYFRKKPYVQHVVHSDYGLGKGSRAVKSPIYKVPDMYEKFHTYAVKWEEGLFTFYIDGYKTFETKNIYEDVILGTPEGEQGMILSVEIAGHPEDGIPYPGIEKDGSKSWLGSIEKMDKSKSYDFIVDYVKVMKQK